MPMREAKAGVEPAPWHRSCRPVQSPSGPNPSNLGKPTDNPSSVQEDCIERHGRCWAYGYEDVCPHSIVMQHAPCKVRWTPPVSSRIVLEVFEHQAALDEVWLDIQDLNERHDMLAEYVWELPPHAPVSRRLRVIQEQLAQLHEKRVSILSGDCDDF